MTAHKSYNVAATSVIIVVIVEKLWQKSTLSDWKSAALKKTGFELQNTKQEETDLLQDNSTQLNKPKLELVHRILRYTLFVASSCI